jgi:hypothetical protein
MHRRCDGGSVQDGVHATTQVVGDALDVYTNVNAGRRLPLRHTPQPGRLAGRRRPGLSVRRPLTARAESLQFLFVPGFPHLPVHSSRPARQERLAGRVFACAVDGGVEKATIAIRAENKRATGTTARLPHAASESGLCMRRPLTTGPKRLRSRRAGLYAFTGTLTARPSYCRQPGFACTYT